jgi:hypothetical protein
MKEQKRLRILGDDEIEAIYGIPRFTPDERIQYFSLSQREKELLVELRSVKSQTYFVLQLGYFKARHLFFTFDLDEVEQDMQFVLSQHFNNEKITNLSAVDKHTRLKQQRLILQLFNYRSCDAKTRQKLAAKAQQSAAVCSKPVYIFRELMHYLSEHNIVAPGYSFMQDTVGQALSFEQKRLTTIVGNHLTSYDIEVLLSLLDNPEGLYEITQLKREPKDFSLSEIKREINRGDQICRLYHLTKRLLPELKISNESIKYYASLVTYYSVFRLKQLSEQMVYVYLLCFVYHRYQRLHDNLIKCLIYKIRGYIDEAKNAAKERVYEHRIESNQDLKKAGQVLKLFTDDSIAEDTPFSRVQTKAFSILERQKLDFIADHIVTNVSFDETAFQWEHVDKLANQFKRHLRPILRAVDFDASSSQGALIEAVHFLKNAFQQGMSLGKYSPETFPKRFIPENTKRYLYGQVETGRHRRRFTFRQPAVPIHGSLRTHPGALRKTRVR